MKNFLFILTLVLVIQPLRSHAQNYKLEKTSDLLDGCGYIHNDKYSFTDALALIQELLKTKLEGDNACSAPLAQLNSQLIQLDAYFNREITQAEKKELAKDAKKEYLLDLESELMLIDQTDPTQASRVASLQTLIDRVKQSVSTLGVESKLARMEDEKNNELQISQKWQNVYANSSAAIATLNSLPNNCVDKLGGWKNMIPVVMKLASSAGTLVGGTPGGIISAGFEAGGQMAILLRNNKVKRAISETNRVQNSQILACTYTLLQTNACELKRAKDLMDDKKKISDLINQRISDTKNSEYEAYFLQISRLAKVQSIFKDVGSMGSALTLDLQLLGRYFAAVRLAPDSIKDSDIPGPETTDDERANFLITMKARGLDWTEYNQNGPTPLQNQVEQVRTLIKTARSVIKTAEAIMTKKRSFYNLKSKIISSNQYIINEMRSLYSFTVRYMDSSSLPSQYRADFKTNEIMLRKMINYLDHNFDGVTDEEYADYLTKVDEKGRLLFEEMARGSIAQITVQTVLMIPDIAFERFNRPFKHLEKLFLTNDIILSNDPTHPSFTNFVINRSMQSKFETYPDFHATREAFRMDTYLAAKNGLEKGFKREIIRMIKNSMNAKSDILTKFEGKTAAHMCALFSSFLKTEAPFVFRKCQERYKSLGLLPILAEANRPTEMKIDYENPCFYNSFKQEEEGQRRLYEKLIDYGSRNNLALTNDSF